MREALNDRFDKVQRRIYIGDGQTNETTYIYTDAEDQDEYLDDTLWLYTEAETADTGLDFIVYVPEEIYTNQIHALHSLIKLYKAGGKRYAILTI
ncbi:hypothetical protein [Flavobacterium cerinum]|uniref:Uncharacterized protein n=1 Tax=Flavobacterium cerinum TaxID=2502784 RepID=A0A3S4ST70_9FLAO|nr:hypothetical protein [Flavobacterium cerinum]RWW91871.1 hypothetical protein EPI11_17670 [Flavobacterium cerinum]